MRKLLFISLLVIVISCNNSTSPGDEIDSVWRISSNTTATWDGEEISTTGSLVGSFDKENVNVYMEGFPDRGRIAIQVEFADVYGGNFRVHDTLSMYSNPLTTNVLKLERRDMPNPGDDMVQLELPGIVMTGEVDCSSTPSSIDNFEIIYKDTKETFIQTNFTAFGMGETAKEITC